MRLAFSAMRGTIPVQLTAPLNLPFRPNSPTICQGRVVFTAPGHTIHALWAPEYVKLQQRAVRWLLKEI
jgi:type 1 glutamine amidotransferase